MFLEFINFSKLPVKSSALRNTTRFFNTFCLQKKLKNLITKKKWQAGRSPISGKIILWTKGALLKKQILIKINYNSRYNCLGFVASFQFIPFKNKLVTLFYFSNGAVTYYLTTETHVLFTYIYLNKKKNLRKFFDNFFWAPILRLKKLIFISFIELFPGKNAQYCLSSGTQSRLVSIDKKKCLAIVQLPSKLKKTISFYSCVFIGKMALSQKKKYTNTKSGYWRSFGIKSCVRGVAMNPIDHPHGGRTKAIRYQRTPWGKTTKYK
jgi:large subunit ribosomal protein L2